MNYIVYTIITIVIVYSILLIIAGLNNHGKNRFRDQSKDNKNLFPPDEIPLKTTKGTDRTVEVAVVIEGHEFKGYYASSSGKWWVNFGYESIGYKMVKDYEIDGWHYL
jgi:hypothetical protein